MSDEHVAACQTFAERLPAATLAHAPAWQFIIPHALGHEDRSLVALRDEAVCGLLPLVYLPRGLFGTFTVSLSWLDYGGTLADDEETARRLLDAAVERARKDKVRFLELRSPDPAFGELPTRDDKVTFLLKLESVEAVWERLDPKVRRHVRTAQRAGLTCEFGREELLPQFYGVFARNMRDLGTPVWGVTLFQNILKAFPKTSEIALVRLGGIPVGGCLVISFKDTVYVPAVSSLRRYFPLRPNNLLYWEVIKRACMDGYRRFDFGRSTIGTGTYDFKKHWGAAIKQLHWQYVLLHGTKIPQLNPSNPRLKLFIEMWKRLPVGIATWLGPHIVRNLP